ncbi:MAG: PepSY domain-containing protein [Pseudomonadota bacterium]
MRLPLRHAVRLHKLVGLVVGLQILFWTGSGLFFTIFPIEQVRGNHLRTTIDHGVLNLNVEILPAGIAASRIGVSPTRAELRMFLGEAVWQFETPEDAVMVDAQSGVLRSPITSEEAAAIAKRGLTDTAGTAEKPFLLSEAPPREYRGSLPAWVISHEPGNVRAYIDASTGRIVSVRTPVWRAFDVLWRFHIMDVTGDDKFHPWWLRIFAFLAVTMALTGLIILLDRIAKGRFLRWKMLM